MRFLGDYSYEKTYDHTNLMKRNGNKPNALRFIIIFYLKINTAINIIHEVMCYHIKVRVSKISYFF